MKHTRKIDHHKMVRHSLVLQPCMFHKDHLCQMFIYEEDTLVDLSALCFQTKHFF